MISVGLELGGHSIKAAVLNGGRSGAKLTAFEVRHIDAKKGEAEDDIVSVLEELLKSIKAPRNQVVCSIRAQDCMIREIVVPFLDDDKIRKTVKYQAENYFTSLSIDDLVIEYSKFAEVENKSKLLVAGIKKSHIARRLSFLEECKVDPGAIDLDVAALYNTYAHAGVFEDKGAVLLVEVEADTLKVGVVEEGRLRLARAIRMRLGSMRLEVQGGTKRLGAASGSYEVQDESARLPVVILDEGDDEAFSLEDSQISEVEREGILHRVFMEIDRTVASVQLAHEVELICLTGASCALDGIEQVFAEHFEIEARRVDIAETFSAPPDKKQKGEVSLSLEGATAVGLALKGLGVDHAGMDFRQEEFIYQGTFSQLKRGLACTLTLLFAIVFLFAFNLKQELREKKGTLRGIKSMQGNLYTVLFPSLEPPADPNQPWMPYQDLAQHRQPDLFFMALQDQRNALAAKYGGGPASGPKVSALEILREFALGKAKVSREWDLQVHKIAIDPRASAQSRFVCSSVDQPGGIQLARRFEGNERVTGQTRDTRFNKKTGRWDFEFIVKLKDEE